MKTQTLIAAISFLTLTFFTTACGGDSADNTQANSVIMKDISVEEFQSMRTDNPGIILDVRTPEEVAQGTVPGSMVINIMDADFEQRVKELDKNAAVYVYCKAGGRSANASDKLNDWGFKEVYNVSGGFDAWSGAGYEVSK